MKAKPTHSSDTHTVWTMRREYKGETIKINGEWCLMGHGTSEISFTIRPTEPGKVTVIATFYEPRRYPQVQVLSLDDDSPEAARVLWDEYKARGFKLA